MNQQPVRTKRNILGSLLGLATLAFFSIILTMHYHLGPGTSTVYGPQSPRAAASRQQKRRTSVAQNSPKSEDASRVKTMEKRLNAVKAELVIMKEKYKILTEAEAIKPNASPSDKKQHAYAFLMAGCDPSKPNTFMGYVYNILVAAYILSLSGSTSDVVVMVRISAGSQGTKLPPDVEEYFHDSNVLVKYLPKPIVDNFYSATMDKFEILDLVQYSRVLFLDSDIMPFCNLDYLFHLSEGPNAVLQENLVFAWRNEPANGGIFMLKPNHTDYLNIKEIQRNQLILNKDGQFFQREGWGGHRIQPPDHWSNRGYFINGTLWSFKGALGCQGLLYYWVKYVKKNVSIINDDKVETWTSEKDNRNDGRVKMSELLSEKQIFQDGCHATLPRYNIKLRNSLNIAPYKDLYHFASVKKPWLHLPEKNENDSSFHEPRTFWFHILREINKERNMGIAIDGGLNITISSQLGEFPTKNQMNEMRKAQLENENIIS